MSKSTTSLLWADLPFAFVDTLGKLDKFQKEAYGDLSSLNASFDALRTRLKEVVKNASNIGLLAVSEAMDDILDEAQVLSGTGKPTKHGDIAVTVKVDFYTSDRSIFCVKVENLDNETVKQGLAYDTSIAGFEKFTAWVMYLGYKRVGLKIKVDNDTVYRSDVDPLSKDVGSMVSMFAKLLATDKINTN